MEVAEVFSLFDLFLALGIGWFIYGAINILTRQNRKEKDTIFAFTVILCFAIHILDHLLRPLPEYKNIIYPILYITRNIYYITGPVLLIYSSSLLHKNTMKLKHFMIHALPFIIWIVLSVLFPDKLFRFSKRVLEDLGLLTPNPKEQMSILATIRVLGAFISPLIYGSYVLLDIRKHRLRVKEFYSDRNTKNTLSWLSILIGIMVIISFIYLIIEIYTRVVNLPPSRNPIRVLSIFPVLFIFYFSYFSKEQTIPKDIKSEFKPTKYEKSTLKDSEITKIHSELLNYMSSSKCFLEPDVNLDDIADKLNVTKHNLSQVINTKSGSNFYSFINTYRVEEFKKAIENNLYPNFTLIAIAMECGFRSSSSFYSVFKKITGKTPKQYMDQLS